MGIRLLMNNGLPEAAPTLEVLQDLRWREEFRGQRSDRARLGRLATNQPIGYSGHNSSNFFNSSVPGDSGSNGMLAGEWYQRERKLHPRMVTPEPRAPSIVECDEKKPLGQQGCAEGKHCCGGFCVPEQELVNEACDGKDCGKGYVPCTKGTYVVECGACKGPKQCCGGSCACCGVDGDSCDGDCKGLCSAGYYCHYERDGKRRCRKKDIPDCAGNCIWHYKPYPGDGMGKIFKAKVDFDTCFKYSQDPLNAWVFYNCGQLKGDNHEKK